MSFPRENVIKALRHEHPVSLPRGELFLDRNFLDDSFQSFKGQYITQVALAARSLGLSAVGIDLDIEHSNRLLSARTGQKLDELFTIGCIQGPASLLIRRFGFFQAMMAIRKASSVLSDVSTCLLKDIENQCRLARSQGICALAITDDIAGNKGLLFSRTDFKNRILPSYRRVAEIIHSNDLFAFFHSDGDTTTIIDSLIEAGYDCLHPVDTQAGLDLNRLMKKFDRQISFMGHIDLLAWNEDRISQKIRWAEKKFINGGLILGSAGGLSMETGHDKLEVLYPQWKQRGPHS
ncbi:MAG: uroporphyrinogen decarboxylase family protein [Thermodesulfobacteriota bacterium]|jgi:uroporphyrinogen-III decarboxylase